MTDPRVTALHSVDIGVADVDAAAGFFTGVWGLDRIAADSGSVWLRGTGPNHHIVALHPRPRAEVIGVNLLVPDTGTVDALHARAKSQGVAVLTAPAERPQPGGGYGFAFRDVEGRNLSVCAGIATHTDTADHADRRRKLAHVVLNADAPEESIAQFTGLLGFRVSDRTRLHNFLRCGPGAVKDHHNIAIGTSGGPTLNQVAFEMPDIDSVMRGAGTCREHGYPIEWGVGRHGPGNNVFAYFVGPEDIPIEYTAEVLQVDESYPAGAPDDWGFPNGRSDQWGVTGPPSDRMKAAQRAIGFAETLMPA